MPFRLRAAVGVLLSAAAVVAATARPSAASIPATISVSGGVSGLANGATGPAFTLTLSQPVASDLTVSLVLTGEGFPGSSVSPSSLVFGPGDTAKTFTLTAGYNLGDVHINYVLSGTDAPNFTAPAPNVVAIKAPMNATLPFPIATGQSGQGSVNVTQVPIQGDLIVSISLAGPAAAGASVTPSVITLSDFNGSASFTLTAGSTPGDLIVNFSVSGTAAAKHAAPGPRTLLVLSPITVSGPSVIPRESTSAPITVTLGIPAPAPLTLNLWTTVAGVTLSTSALTFAAGESSKTFTITTGANYTPQVVVFFGAAGDGASSYLNPPAFWTAVQARIRINIGTNTVPRNQSRQFTVSLDRQATAPLTVTLSLSGPGAAGSSLSQTVVEFGPGIASKLVTLQAGPNIGDAVISGVASGSEIAYYTAPESATYRVVAFSSFQGGSGPVANEAPVTFSLILPLPAPGPITADLSVSGAAAPGVTLTPATLAFATGETSKTFTIAGTTIGTATLSVALSGPGAEYLVGTNRPFSVAGRAAISGQPTSMPVSSTTSDITVTLPIPSPVAFTLNIFPSNTAGAGSSVTTSPLSFAVGDVSKTFTITSGTATGPMTVFLTPSPSSGGLFRFSSFTIQVVGGVPTPTGLNVTVTPPAVPGVSSSVSVTFAEVTAGGSTQLSAIPSGAQFAPPSGFELPGAPLYFSVATTAQVAGPVTVCSSYPDGAAVDETSLRMFMRMSGVWVDVTSTVDTGANVVCGELASLSFPGPLFAIFRLNAPPQVGTISGPALVEAGTASEFTAVVSDPNATDTLKGEWLWGDGTTSPATIATVDGVSTATGTHAFGSAGTYTVALVVSDGGQQARSNDHDVRVDAAPPVINALAASPERIWPPDNRMHAVTLMLDVTDDSGLPPVCEITKVEASGERAPGLGAGEYAITSPLTLSLQAAMFRVYAITVTCTDAVGRSTTATVNVAVAREM